MNDYLDTPSGRRIAYRRTTGQGPGIVFLGGFRSDMQGSKAVHLRDWAAAHGRQNSASHAVHTYACFRAAGSVPHTAQ